MAQSHRLITPCLIASVLMTIALAGAAVAMFVDVQFIGGVDIATYETWGWGQGEPLPNQEVERAARATVEELMRAKGYVKSDGEADCYLTFSMSPRRRWTSAP